MFNGQQIFRLFYDTLEHTSHMNVKGKKRHSSLWQCHEKSDNKEIHISTGHDKLYRYDKISYYLLEHMLTKVYIYIYVDFRNKPHTG